MGNTVQFGARPGHRAAPRAAEAPVNRVHGEIKKITSQPGKIEILFASESVGAEIVSRIAELQQLGAVYISFESAPPLAEIPPETGAGTRGDE